VPFIVKAVSRIGRAHWLSDAGMRGIRTFAPKERAEVFSTRDDAHRRGRHHAARVQGGWRHFLNRIGGLTESTCNARSRDSAAHLRPCALTPMLIPMDSRFAAAALLGRNWMAELLQHCGPAEAKARLRSKRGEFSTSRGGGHLSAEEEGYLYGAEEARSEEASGHRFQALPGMRGRPEEGRGRVA
jgi:hypothetical protein